MWIGGISMSFSHVFILFGASDIAEDGDLKTQLPTAIEEKERIQWIWRRYLSIASNQIGLNIEMLEQIFITCRCYILKSFRVLFIAVITLVCNKKKKEAKINEEDFGVWSRERANLNTVNSHLLTNQNLSRSILCEECGLRFIQSSNKNKNIPLHSIWWWWCSWIWFSFLFCLVVSVWSAYGTHNLYGSITNYKNSNSNGENIG